MEFPVVKVRYYALGVGVRWLRWETADHSVGRVDRRKVAKVLLRTTADQRDWPVDNTHEHQPPRF
jgi:hypothetical protein